MSNEQKLKQVVGLVDKLCINPDVDVDYFIPGVKVTKDVEDWLGDPYVEFSYLTNGMDSHVQQLHIKDIYLEKSPTDIANLVTFSLEQFIAEIDSREYGAQ